MMPEEVGLEDLIDQAMSLAKVADIVLDALRDELRAHEETFRARVPYGRLLELEESAGFAFDQLRSKIWDVQATFLRGGQSDVENASS